MSCVYRLTFPDGSVYIGRSDGDPKDRWRDGWGYSQSSMVFKAIFYFGWKNVKKEVIASGLTHEESVEMENREIAVHSAVCTVHNEDGVPAQCLAQNNYIPRTLAQRKSTEQILKDRHKQIEGGFYSRKKLNEYVVPLVPKPDGVHHCPIDVYSTDGEYICTYQTAKEASIALNVNAGEVASCCKGVKADGSKRYQTKGYVFRYHNPEFETS